MANYCTPEQVNVFPFFADNSIGSFEKQRRMRFTIECVKAIRKDSSSYVQFDFCEMSTFTIQSCSCLFMKHMFIAQPPQTHSGRAFRGDKLNLRPKGHATRLESRCRRRHVGVLGLFSARVEHKL